MEFSFQLHRTRWLGSSCNRAVTVAKSSLQMLRERNVAKVFSCCKQPYIVGQFKNVYYGKWLSMREVKYRRQGCNNEKVWESAHRRTPPKGRPNGVEIIATLRRGGKIYFVFVKEYRIPFAAYCLEFPAGLLEDNETVVEGAMRELKEETGYVACKVTSVSGGKQPMHSQMSDVCTCFATAEIDGDTKENENPKSRLDDAEEIEVVLVECNKAPEYVKSAPKGVYVDAIVSTKVCHLINCCTMNQKGAIDLCTSTTVLSNECPFQLVDQPNVVYRGQWTKTIKTRYRQREGETEKVCESIHRKAPTAGRPHCVEVITILHKGGNDYFVFIKEYRIPMNGYCFEFPAGLLEEDETVDDAARRELKEETGYTASKVTRLCESRHPLAAYITDNSASYALAEVDGDSTENRNPKLCLDDAEIIEVVEVECNKALAYVQSIATEVHVDGMVYAFLLGYTCSH